MIRNEAAVWPGGMAEALVHHSAQHGLQSRTVSIIVGIHLLEGGTHVHLLPRNRHGSIEEIKIR